MPGPACLPGSKGNSAKHTLPSRLYPPVTRGVGMTEVESTVGPHFLVMWWSAYGHVAKILSSQSWEKENLSSCGPGVIWPQKLSETLVLASKISSTGRIKSAWVEEGIGETWRHPLLDPPAPTLPCNFPVAGIKYPLLSPSWDLFLPLLPKQPWWIRNLKFLWEFWKFEF